ncbi:predicted protein [Uncinocarpus reesii 1704]|uniref:Uncharacterized protein n=1 Tax=Uncinocarpus reesii (strain UAMH 1704) TaxID=336963 RepID=C4JDP6_UNCRE|nr:uncharacterized protein UREG_00360 [Uncinocarpus reesii 1704]EEP75514.1 predicted protein [Uncinocarpus reesii 1704]
MRFNIAAITAFVATVMASPAPTAAPQPNQVAPNPPCYTHHTSVYPNNCAPIKDCVTLPCIVEETRGLPCHTDACPTTTTSLTVLPCTTTCRAGCETSTVYTKSQC